MHQKPKHASMLFAPHRLTLLTCAAWAALCATAAAQTQVAAVQELPEVTVKGNYDNAVGTSDAAKIGRAHV